jgi:hypothetical protein
MGAGLLQLVAKGGLNDYIVANPSISFFNYVYRKHTNFAIENLTLTFETIPSLLTNMHISNDYTVNLTSRADVDLLSNLYLIFTLPAIYSDAVYKFKWIENVGSLLIKSANFQIGKVIIDTITGEWLVIWNELTLPVKDSFNDMTGNVPALNNPRKPETTIRIRNNIISDYDYLSSDGNTPSINSRILCIPLNFWFTKNPSLALPIVKLVGNYSNDIKLKIEFEDIENLYVVYSDIYNMHISPRFYNYMHNERIDITKFIRQNAFVAHVEATYIILDTAERGVLINSCTQNYLIEKLSIKSDQFTASVANTVNTITIQSQLGIKEIIWTLKRGDVVDNFNDYFNYTYSIPKNNEKSIMKNAKLIWDGGSGNPFFRVEEKEAYFYNKLQPYQHHTAIPMQGIYVYSFSLYPEKWFPSGFYNGAFVKTILSMTFNSYENNYIDTIYAKKSYTGSNKKIYCNVYVLEHNVLEIINGNIGLKFAN